MQWLPDGTALIVSARERRVSPLRLWHLPSATGVRRPLTHDPSDYTLAGVSADGRRIFAVQENVARSFWAADLSSVEMATRVTVDSGSHGGLEGIAWGADGRLLYSTADADNNVDIWSVDTATNARAQLTRDPAEDYQPTVTVDGRTVAFVSTRSGAPAIWVMAIDGSNPRKLTAGSDTRPFISSDGQWVAFQREAVDTVPVGVWRVPIAGGDSSPVTVQHTIRPAISPDGAHIAHYWMTSQNWMLAVSSVADRQRVGTFPLSPTHLDRVVRWSPDGRALAYIDGAGGVSNIWLQPLDGGAPHKLTNFPEGTITTFDWSRDRSKLAWVRTTEVHDVVSIDLK
jgi:Tol biopolymer transport system component